MSQWQVTLGKDINGLFPSLFPNLLLCVFLTFTILIALLHHPSFGIILYDLPLLSSEMSADDRERYETYQRRRFTDSFHQFTNVCLQTDPHHR
jgi:hypothetical protein